MPKNKTRKAISKRFRRTGSGKIMRMYGARNNHRLKKRKPVRVKFGRTVPVEGAYAATVDSQLDT